MNRNKQLYDACGALVNCAKFVKLIDNKYAQELLDKAQEYIERIVIDEKLELEVDEFEKRIKEGINKKT